MLRQLDNRKESGIRSSQQQYQSRHLSAHLVENCRTILTLKKKTSVKNSCLATNLHLSPQMSAGGARGTSLAIVLRIALYLLLIKLEPGVPRKRMR